MEDKKNRRLVSWQTRTLAQIIAATIPLEKGQENPVAEQATKISIDAMEADELKQALEQHLAAPVENRAGSFEKLVTGFNSTPG